MALIGGLLYFWTKRSKTRKHPSPRNSAIYNFTPGSLFVVSFGATWTGFPILIGNAWLMILPFVVFYKKNNGFPNTGNLAKLSLGDLKQKDSLWKFLGTSFRKEPTPKKAPQGLGSFCCKGGQSYPPSLGINETCSKLQIDSPVAQTSQRSSAVVGGSIHFDLPMEFSWSAIGGLYTHSTMVFKKTREVVTENGFVQTCHPPQC